MGEQRENDMDLIWNRTMELFIKIHDYPDSPEHRDNLVHWLNEDSAHLKAFNELGQIWIAAGIALAREVGQPLGDLEKDQPPLMVH